MSAEFSISLMDRQRLEPRKNAYDAFVTLPVRGHRSSTATCFDPEALSTRMVRDPVRILYLADIRFPLERANGIQSMETCHALATQGHAVTLVVRPDSQAPARDPFVFYGLPRVAGLDVEIAPITGPVAARRAGYVTYAIGRAMGRRRQDLIFTRDLGLASLLLRIPAALRAPVVEAHGIAADVAAALPAL